MKVPKSKQPMLPGMSHLGRQFDAAQAARPAASQYDADWDERGRQQWSGPIPGQTVIGMTAPDIEERPYGRGPWTADEHGNVTEDYDEPGDYLQNYYRSHGGANKMEPVVQAHWKKQPLRQIRADTPISTAQGAEDIARDWDEVQKVEHIRESLESGQPLHKPAWLVQSHGRLYALDGHHRMLAARQAGEETYPARVWNLEDERHPPVSSEYAARENWEGRLQVLQRAQQRRYRTAWGGFDRSKYENEQNELITS